MAGETEHKTSEFLLTHLHLKTLDTIGNNSKEFLEVISHSNIKDSRPEVIYKASESTQNVCNKGVFSFIILLQLQ